MRKVIVGGAAAALIFTAFMFTPPSATAAGPEGCITQSGNNGAVVGNPAESSGEAAPPSGSAPGATCAYQATSAGGWAGGGVVTITYGPGTLATGATACTYAPPPAPQPAVFTNTSGPFNSSSSLPGALGPIAAGDCVSVSAG